MKTNDTPGYFIRIDDRLVTASVACGELRMFSYFILFKYTFSSSKLNDRNLSSLALRCGINVKTARKWFNRFVERGWVRMDGEDAVFVKQKKIFNYYKGKGFIPGKAAFQRRSVYIGENTCSGIETALLGNVVAVNLGRQMYVKRNCNYLVKLREREAKGENVAKEIATTKRILRHFGIKPSGVKSFTEESSFLSCEGFGRLCGKSKASGHRIKTKLKREKLILTKERVVRHSGISFEQFKQLRRSEENSGRFYFIKGILHERLSDQIFLGSGSVYACRYSRVMDLLPDFEVLPERTKTPFVGLLDWKADKYFEIWEAYKEQYTITENTIPTNTNIKASNNEETKETNNYISYQIPNFLY
jgi:hypothetical protein